MTTRPPAVAGLFYPDDARTLAGDIDRLLAEASPREDQPLTPPKGLIVPHAGYVYSGAIAATGYEQLRPHLSAIKRIVLLGPSHRVPLRGVALATANAFATPLGSVEVDATLAEVAKAHPSVARRDDAHMYEHSLEVHLPFLQRLLPQVPVLPLVVGDTLPEDVAQLVAALSHEIGTLIVVSTDLSHFLDYESALSKDAGTTAAINALSEDIDPYQACGCRPLNGVLRYAREQGWTAATLDVRNSGDTAGTPDRVVGYGAYVLQ